VGQLGVRQELDLAVELGQAVLRQEEQQPRPEQQRRAAGRPGPGARGVHLEQRQVPLELLGVGRHD
jgi:hypothetical protein